jgi:hypothetical protein
MGRNRASARPKKKVAGKSERRIRLSTLPTELRQALVLDIDAELRRAHREKTNATWLRAALVKVIRRLVQQHGLASVGYRFESSLSLEPDPIDVVMMVASSAYTDGVLVYSDDLAERIANDLADQQAL